MGLGLSDSHHRWSASKPLPDGTRRHAGGHGQCLRAVGDLVPRKVRGLIPMIVAKLVCLRPGFWRIAASVR